MTDRRAILTSDHGQADAVSGHFTTQGSDAPDLRGGSTRCGDRSANVANRRGFLAACGGLVAAASGCVSQGRPSGETTKTRTATESATSDPEPFESPTDHCRSGASRANSDPLALEIDSRARFGCSGILLDGMEDLGPWQTYDGTLAPDRDRVARGSQSARLETTPPGGRVWVYRRFEPGLDLSDHDLSVAIHPGRGESKATMLRAQLLAPDYQNRIDMRHGVGELGGWFRMDLGPTVVKGEPDLTDVREIRLQSLAGSRERVRLNVDELRLVPKADRGRVMFTFDDIPRSQYTEAFPLLDEYGYAGVAGAIPWLTEDPEFLSEGQLRELQHAGWDVVSHPQLTSPSRPLPTLSRTDQARALERSKRWLVENGFEQGAQFVIWPFHAADATTLELGSRYHYLGFAGGRSPSSIPPTDPLTVGRVDGDNVADARKMIAFAERYRQLTVVMFHRVGRDGLSTRELEGILDTVEQSELAVITATDLWELVTG